MKHSKFASAVTFTISMMFVTILMIGALGAALLNSAPTYAAQPQVLVTDVTLPMVAFEDNQLKLFGFSGTPQVIDSQSTPFMGNQVWSPDGKWLAYIVLADDSGQLMLTDTLGRTPQVIATGLNSGLPIQFSSDNSQLIYAVVPDPSQATSINGLYTVEVFSQTIGSSNAPVKLGSFEQASCGGGGPSVYDALYWAEAGTGGMRPILAVNDLGIIHSLTCQGVGVAVMNPNTGVDTLLDSDITRVSLSNDGQTLLGVKNNQLMIIDIATGETATFETDAIPDQVIWGAPDTGNVYYTVRQTTDDVVSYTASEQQTIMNATGLDVSEVADNIVAVHRFNLESNQDTVVYESTAYTIGHISLVPDNRLLMVSEVPSLQQWFESILTSDNSGAPQLKTELYLVSLEDGETRLLGTGLLGARLNDVEYLRLFGANAQLTAQPNTVTVGGQVRLTGANFPIQSRVLISMGANANTLDDLIYAAGFTNEQGELTLSFNMPAAFKNGQAISGQVTIVATTSDELVSAETRITVNRPTTSNGSSGNSNTNNNTGLPTPVKVATVSISPDAGTVGTQININGQGFPANSRVNIHMGNVTVGASNVSYASATTDANGQVSLTFTMPGVYADGTAIQASQVLIIAATDNFSTSASLVFNFAPVSAPVYMPSISLSPTTVKVNNKMTIHGKGFAPNTNVNILIGVNANDLRGIYHRTKTDGSGTFEISFKMPEKWKDAGKVKEKRVLVVAAPTNSTASASAWLGVKFPRKSSGGGSTGVDDPVIIEEPSGEEPSEGGEEPSGEEPSEGGEEPGGEEPSEGGEEPSGEEPSEGGEEPSGEEPSEGGEEPSGEEPSEGGEEPSGEEPSEGGEEPSGEEPSEEDEGEETPVILPSVAVTPASATIGETVTVSGSDFEPNSVISVYLVGDLSTSSVVVTADENGTFATAYTVPSESSDLQPMTAGNYMLYASSADKNANTPFTISG